jgi:hypothetical protein
MELELVGHVAPFLRIVGEDAGQDADYWRNTFPNNLKGGIRLAILLDTERKGGIFPDGIHDGTTYSTSP